MPTVKLSDNEIKKAEKLAEERLSTLPKDEKGNVDHDSDMARGTVSIEETHSLGALGEIAASKLFNIEIDRSVSSTGDEGYDFVLNNKKVDLKVKEHSDPHLMIRADRVDEGHFDDVDAFMLVYREDERTFTFVGYASYEELISKGSEEWPSDILNYHLDWRYLHRIDEADDSSEDDQEMLEDFLD